MIWRSVLRLLEMRRLNTLGAVVVALLVVSGCDQADQSEGVSQSEAQQTVQVRKSGQEIYDDYCFSCHNLGLNAAPVLGDIEAWMPRAAKGMPLLLEATIQGIPPAMPPRGMCIRCTDEDLTAAIQYMIQIP